MHTNEPTSYSSLFRNKPFMLLWLNQFCLQLSYSLINFSMLLWVYELTGKSLYVAAILMTISLPALLFGLFAGVVVDRINRRKIIQITDICTAVLMFCFYFVNDSIWMLFLLAFCVSVVSQFFFPAEGASIPSVVDKKDLVRANSLFSLTIYASLILGYGIAGPLISLTDSYVTPFLIAGLISCVAGILFSAFPVLPQKIVSHRDLDIVESFHLTIRELKSGIRFLLSHHVLLVGILLLTSVQTFVSTLSVLIPVYVQRVLQIPATNASYIIMFPLGLGLITGAFFNGAYGRHFSRRQLVEISVVGVGIMLLLLSFAPVISDYFAVGVGEIHNRLRRPLEHVLGLSGLLAIFSYLLGFFNVSIVIPAQTVIQELTPEHMRGRVFGFLSMMMATIPTVPVIFVGTFADIFGVVRITTFLAIVVLSVGVLTITRRIVLDSIYFRR